ncbi:hypothetical protein RHMOL_Rhmol06G0090200 [Rhododendron molle]|uniref:Uncharacterized protein n=1 Tax=Rhododendron molle TaxID=49168 RepID=A0ACC0NCP2_RHOML|nr:hypothetical protein RHMOL_Rhmol06G0090200 [Rhododendron molle]
MMKMTMKLEDHLSNHDKGKDRNGNEEDVNAEVATIDELAETQRDKVEEEANSIGYRVEVGSKMATTQQSNSILKDGEIAAKDSIPSLDGTMVHGSSTEVYSEI